ncbi:MAG: type IV pilus modification protein PilV [Methylotenera sp.]
MNHRYHSPSPVAQQGVVLLEALIAILIFSMGILAVAGLQASMIKNTSDSKYRADAAFIAQQSLGRMWADPANLTTYAKGTENIPDLLPNGKRTVTVVALPVVTGEVKVEVAWQVPGQDAHKLITYARITGG